MFWNNPEFLFSSGILPYGAIHILHYTKIVFLDHLLTLYNIFLNHPPQYYITDVDLPSPKNDQPVTINLHTQHFGTVRPETAGEPRLIHNQNAL